MSDADILFAGMVIGSVATGALIMLGLWIATRWLRRRLLDARWPAMTDPQVVWTREEASITGYRAGVWDTQREEGDTPAIEMTPEYRAELRKLVERWYSRDTLTGPMREATTWPQPSNGCWR